MDELIGIYKGLRLPLLGLVLMFVAWYVYRPSRREEMEQAKYDMLNDEAETDISGRSAGQTEQEKHA